MGKFQNKNSQEDGSKSQKMELMSKIQDELNEVKGKIFQIAEGY